LRSALLGTSWMLIKESVERVDNSGRTSFATIMATFEILKQVSEGRKGSQLAKGERTCFLSIFPMSKSSGRKIRTPLLLPFSSDSF
jgi:hypothetical protein